MYNRYETGLTELLRQMGKHHPRYNDALTYQQRLLENILLTQQYDDNENRRSERTEISTHLNSLALEVMGITFNELVFGVQRPLQRQANEKVVPPPHALAMPWKFDLSQIEEDFLNSWTDTSKLTGFVIPCESNAFQENCCERLKDILKAVFFMRNVRRKPPHTLNRLISFQDVVGRIKQYKRTLQEMHLICPVHVTIDDHESAEKIVSSFWDALRADFECDLEHNLIVIMFTCVDINPSDSIIRLDPPTIKKSDILKWTGEVVRSKQWPRYVLEQWQKAMIRHCRKDDLYDIHMVYDHLDEILHLMQDAALKPDEFLERIM
jgi:hypothetical protein